MQYEIVIVNLDPTIGHEIKKTRPCVVISPDEMNENLATIIVSPLTSTERNNYPTRIGFVAENGIQNWIVLDQIRTIDKARIKKFTGERLPEETVDAVKNILRTMLVD